MVRHVHSARGAHTMRNILLLVLGVLVVLGAVGGFCAWRFYQQAMDVRDHELAAVEAVSGLQDVSQLRDADTMNAAIEQAQVHASAAKEIADGALWRVASYVPVLGDDVTAVRGMVDVVDGMVGETLPSLASTVQTLMNSGLSGGGEGQLNLQPIVDAQEGFAQANELVQQQADTINALPQPHVGVVRSAYEQGKEQINKVADMLDQVSGMVQAMPKLLGQDGPRTYLLVAQTTSEQRSGGGLVGSLGTMQVDNGNISVGDFHSNKEFVPLGESATAEEHDVFSGPLSFSFDVRDLFAVPDFSRTAEMLNTVWQRSEYACDIDGVIAIDPLFIQEMVRINGDITLDNGQVLTGDNTAEFMLNGIYKAFDPDTQDVYFEYVASAVMDGAFSNMTMDKMMQIAQAMGTLAEGRHFYAYTFHEDEAEYFQGAGFAKNAPDNETDPEVGIYMNEQNASKLGWYLHRSSTVTRTACNEDGSQVYHVTFSITNTLTSDEMASATTYILGGAQPGVDGIVAPAGTSAQRMLFYAPAGGSITNLTASGDVRDQEEKTMDGKNLITNVAYIAPGETVTFDFDVTTSAKAESDLRLDQTPAGWLEENVTYDTSACSIK
ncbi:DUF4012 domain-containing protein [Bifidobacterium pullorum subsp. gallinarum]|uniref:DUF4012 domain-containing protein n=2 Tax=Bifidobacterium pullorum TaxID=78448 RepID=A0A4P6DX51_9BIFI|nr:DUF4012 domain-containing protein [Bifidobacterium pullorum subsp. gallinarum]